MSTDKCPTCNAPVKISWSGLDLVEQTGDENLATKHYTYQAPAETMVEDNDLAALLLFDQAINLSSEHMRAANIKFIMDKYKIYLPVY